MSELLETLTAASAHVPDDQTFEATIRPQLLQDYVGQTDVKTQIGLFLQAAKLRSECVDHCLLAGPPGLGKTTLAHIIAHEMGSALHTVAGPNIDKKGDLAAILTNLEKNDVLFIDEIHRLAKPIEEILYSAMEDFKLDLIAGQGPAARTISLDLPPFTLVGATTKTGLLSNPLRDRFGIQLRLAFYPAAQLAQILLRSSVILKVTLDESAAQEIARRSRGTPRIANRLLRRLRDFAQVQKTQPGVLTLARAQEALTFFDIDPMGLDTLDRAFLSCLLEKFDGGPVGIDTLSAALSEESATLEEVTEPYLMQEGFIKRTPRGRVATATAYQHLGLPQRPSHLSAE